MAPPFTFTLSISASRSCNTHKAWAAKASLASIKSMSFIVNWALSNAFLVAGIGPVPIIEGSTPALAKDLIVAKGLAPIASAFSLDIKTMAAAPSLIPEELAAVTDPPSRLKAGLNLANDSWVTPALGYSSASIWISSPRLCGTATGVISSWNLLSLIAASAFCWLEAASASCSSLVNPYFPTIFSAVIPIW